MKGHFRMTYRTPGQFFRPVQKQFRATQIRWQKTRPPTPRPPSSQPRKESRPDVGSP